MASGVGRYRSPKRLHAVSSGTLGSLALWDEPGRGECTLCKRALSADVRAVYAHDYEVKEPFIHIPARVEFNRAVEDELRRRNETIASIQETSPSLSKLCPLGVELQNMQPLSLLASMTTRCRSNTASKTVRLHSSVPTACSHRILRPSCNRQDTIPRRVKRVKS